MTTATFTQPDYTSQSASAYKAALDGAAMVFSRLAGAFAPHAQSTPDMTVRLDAGAIVDMSGSVPTVTEIAAQNTGTITAPSGSNKRIDLVVIDQTSGAVSVITGTPTTGTAAVPALTAGKLPVAQIGTPAAPMTSSTTSITNSMLTDIRVLPIPKQFTPRHALLTYELSNTTGAGVLTAGAWTKTPLNTEVYDPDNIVSLSSNQFTLGAGTYLIEASLACYVVGNSIGVKARIRNTTDSTTDAVGHNSYGSDASTDSATSIVPPTRVVLTGSKVYELQYWATVASGANTLGTPMSTGEVERYAQVKITQIAP